MVTVAVQDKFAETLTALGDLQESVNVALQRYTIEQISDKINDLRRRNAEFQARYGLDYPTFSKRIAEEDTFVQHVEDKISKTWEIDLLDWEFCYKGMDDWKKKLQDILLA
jgi:hypothetical protein